MLSAKLPVSVSVLSILQLLYSSMHCADAPFHVWLGLNFICQSERPVRDLSIIPHNFHSSHFFLLHRQHV